MPETHTESPVNQTAAELTRQQIAGEGAASLLAPQAIEAVGLALQTFHGAENHTLGVTPDGEFRSIVAKRNKDGSITNETAGAGRDITRALENALEGARSLEKVSKGGLIHMKIKGEMSVDFSELKYFSPKIAPTSEIHAVPDYLQDSLTDSAGNQTYAETIAQPGWDRLLMGMTEDYVIHSARGRQVYNDLKINSLSTLSPEQAVKLSLAMVQDLSKYSKDGNGQPDMDDALRADKSTTMQLLLDGVRHHDDPNWKGNGVCRNVASNTKAVFEALKKNQSEQSMLGNTYAIFDTGYRGESYDDKRKDDSTIENNSPLSGHAWVKFVTVDSKGSANITIVDPTWALEKDPSSALQHMDYTLPRMAKLAKELFSKSDSKKEVFNEQLSYFYYRRIRDARPLTQAGAEGAAEKKQIEEFIVTEYLESAAILQPELEEGDEFPDDNLGHIIRLSYGLGDRLSVTELTTLYKISQYSEKGISHVIKSFVNGNTVKRQEADQIKRFRVSDDNLQKEIFTALGKDRITDFASKQSLFRARVRELMPDALPSFDPSARQEDAKELVALAKGTSGLKDLLGGHYRDVIKIAQFRLRREAGSDDVYEAATSGISDYDLIKNYDHHKAQFKKS
jgi:hypothetical protein